MIEFYLPTEGGVLWDITKKSIEIRMYIWADKHNVNYTGKVLEDKLLIEFPEEKDYTLFMLTWETKGDKWKMLKII
jgi:hypothetical protein